MTAATLRPAASNKAVRSHIQAALRIRLTVIVIGRAAVVLLVAVAASERRPVGGEYRRLRRASERE